MNLGRGKVSTGISSASRPGMPHKALAVPLAIAALLLGVVACGSEEETEILDDGTEVPFVVEGEPLELGHLSINVQLTRFLNPNDVEDSEYLEGLAPPPPDKDYLGVFMEAENDGDEPIKLPDASQVTISDTTGAEFEPVETENVFALDLGGEVEADGQAPKRESAAAQGPVQGAILIFLVDQTVSDNRPLDMELAADGETGIIELDI